MKSGGLNIICPVKDQDWGRFSILIDSLYKHLKIDNKIIVISPSGASPIKDKNISYYKDIDIIPQLINPKYNHTGWWKQQALKLAAVSVTEYENILILDADCFMVKDMYYSDICHEDKLKIKISSGGSWDNWYHGSSKILQMDFTYKNNRIGVTPVILSRSIMKGLESYLKNLYGDSPYEYLLSNTTILCDDFTPKEAPTWTEYCLYHIYGVNSGLWNNYHINSNLELSGNCFWDSIQAERWDPSKSFNNPSFFFTVAQSIAGKDAEWIKNKIQQFL